MDLLSYLFEEMALLFFLCCLMLSTPLGKVKFSVQHFSWPGHLLSHLSTTVGLKCEFWKQRQLQKVHPTYSFCTISRETDEGMYKLPRLTQTIGRHLHRKHVAKRFSIPFISEIKEDNSINHWADTTKIRRSGPVYSFPKLFRIFCSSTKYSHSIM